MSFTGFTRETLYTPVPNPLFGEVLEQIQDLAELKVTLRGLWMLHRRQTAPRAVTLDEFLTDGALLRGLGGPDKDGADEIRLGLRLAVGRGTFLAYENESGQILILLNNDAGRRALERLQLQPVRPEAIEGQVSASAEASDPFAVRESERIREEKPNIFALYEDNIGMLSPILAEQLKEAEERYPRSWLSEAFQIAVLENKRSWRYIAGILRRWSSEGKDGRLGGGVEHGKPGRHSSQDQRQKHIEEYQRWRTGAHGGKSAARKPRP